MRIGEVIETSIVGLWAESTALHDVPPLGSLVAVALEGGETLYGVVAFGQTAGLDAGRQAGRQVARLLKRDYDRLLTVLEAIDPGEWQAGIAAAAISPDVRGPERPNGRKGYDDVPF